MRAGGRDSIGVVKRMVDHGGCWRVGGERLIDGQKLGRPIEEGRKEGDLRVWLA